MEKHRSPSRLQDALILVVDDTEPFGRDEVSSALQGLGFSVLQCDSGDSALAALGARAVDVVVLDHTMPGLSGIDTLVEIRKRYSDQALPVIMIIGGGPAGAHERQAILAALRAGANDFVTKPVDLEILAARVRRQFAYKQMGRALEESRKTLDLVLTGSRDGFWDWDLATDRIAFSERWKDIVGLAPTSAISEPADWFSRVHPDDLDRLQQELRLHTEGVDHRLWTEHRLAHSDGTYRWVVARAAAVRDGAGKAERIAGTLSDITGHKATDLVTSLPNRTLLNDRIRHARDRAARDPGDSFAVLVIRLSGYDRLTDALGPKQARSILQHVARKLEGVTRTSDTLAILDGSTFAILAHSLVNNEDCMRIVERIGSAFKNPITIDGVALRIECNIGIAFNDNAEGSELNVLRNAESAARRAVENRTEHVAIFDSKVQKEVARKWAIEQNLRTALEKDQFFLVYQPIVDTLTGRVRALEALMRWRDDHGNLISPAEFIPVAEGTGLILPLGEWAMRRACSDIKALIEAGALSPQIRVHVNVSPRQLSSDTFERLVADAIRASRLEPQQLVLEITEQIFIEDLERTSQMLRALAATGVECALDDFGTGFSSLKYLGSLPISELKIDQSFIQSMGADNGAIVDAIIALAHGLKMAVVAEGVETESQRKQLRLLGCDMIQGFFFSEPRTVGDLPKTVASLAEDAVAAGTAA